MTTLYPIMDPPSSPSRLSSDSQVPVAPLPQEEANVEYKNGTFDDKIGDTVLSKTWVLSLLVKTVESISQQAEESCEGLYSGHYHRDTTEGGGEESSKVNSTGCRGDSESSDGCEVSVIGGSCHSDFGSGDSCHGDGESNDDVEDTDLEEKLCILWDASMNTVSLPSPLAPITYASTI